MNANCTIRLTLLLFMVVILNSALPSTCPAKVLTWNFKAKVTSLYGFPEPLLIGVAVGDTLSGSFAYDDSIIKSNPTNHYAEYYKAPVSEVYFKIDTYGLTRRKKWNAFEVAVIQQKSRQIARVRMKYTKNNSKGEVKEEEMTVGTIDDTRTLFPAEVLPINWHMVPINYWFSFDYELRQYNGEYIKVSAQIEEMVLQ